VAEQIGACVVDVETAAQCLLPKSRTLKPHAAADCRALFLSHIRSLSKFTTVECSSLISVI